MSTQAFTKMHALGNDFVLARGPAAPAAGRIRELANRFTGIGFDQFLWLEEPHDPETDVFYRIFNADGGEVEQCGNGARCIARHVAGDSTDTERVWKLGFPGGVVDARLLADGDVAVNMGVPAFTPDSLPFEADAEAATYAIEAGGETVQIAIASMGNPHGVLTVDNVDDAPVATLGPLLESHARFPQRANIGFMQVVGPDRIRLRVFERGVGETRACGTGACAAVVTGVRAGVLGNDVAVELPGGELRVRWDGVGTPVWLVGEAVTAFTGEVDFGQD